MAISTSTAPSGTDPERDASLKRETIRNRINQRAFRLRRQEYVRELEEQVRSFQKQGIQATKEVQIAARNVATENALLRRFIKDNIDCTDQDVDTLLARMRSEGSDAPRSPPSECNANRGMTGLMVPRPPTASSVREPLTEQQISAPAKPLERATIAVHASQDPQHVHTWTATKLHIASCVAAQQAPGPIPDHQHHHLIHEAANSDLEPSPNSEDTERNLPSCKAPENSISCEEAATIIAGLRQRNDEDAREELGCQTQASCHIKSIALLQLMNDTF